MVARIMSKEPHLSSLTAIFGSTQDKSQEDSEKLLDLYWNRAELKKEFAGVQKEQFKLQDKIKQQEGVAARVQQRLDHLEELLVDPDWAHNVVVFYQMRGLALRCQDKLAKFSEQLKQQREQKQHNRLLVSWNEERTREARVLEGQLTEKVAVLQQLEDQLQAERRRLSSMSGFLKIFKRRSVNASLNSFAERIAVTQEEEESLLLGIEEIQNRTPPDTEGLDISTKRSINLMIVAFAQQLYLTFADDDLAAMAKESSEKSVGAINYGNHEDCEQVLQKIRQVTEWMEQASDFAETLQHRSKLIGEKALFRNDTDVVPASGTVAILYDIDANGLVKESDISILGENWWGISKILSR
jgi:chromosome segregation ATPase